MSKYRVTQRNLDSIPEFQVAVVDFDTVEQLEDIAFVKQWAANPKFVRFSLFQGVLLVELQDNNVGIAFIKNLEGFPTNLSDLPLPAWIPPRPPPKSFI